MFATAPKKKEDVAMGSSYMTDLQRQLLDRRIIDLGGVIDGDLTLYTREAIMRLTAAGSPDFETYFTSIGGPCPNGFTIYDMYLDYQGRITGLVFNRASSIASIILQACDLRLAAEHAKIMIHYSYLNLNNLSRAQRKDKKFIEKQYHDSDQIDRDLIQIYMRRAIVPRRVIARAMMEEKEFSAQEALKLGLIDGIIKPKKMN